MPPTDRPPIDRRRVLQGLAGAAWLAGGSTAQPVRAQSLPLDWWPLWQQGRLGGFTTENLPGPPAEDRAALWRTGARVVRVGLHLRRTALDGRYTATETDLQAALALLDEAANQRGAVVLLGLFDDGQQPQPLWSDPALQTAWVQAWAGLARRLGHHPALAGLDLLNEPQPTGQPLPAAQQAWARLAWAGLLAVRGTGCTTPVVVQPVLGAHPSALQDTPLLPDPAVVYSPHFYTPHDITHQFVNASWQRAVPYPAGPEWQLGAWDPELGVGRIDRDRLAAELRFVHVFQARSGAPVFIGEFGCVRWAPDGAALRWVADCLALFADARWNWAYHTHRGWTGWDAEVATADPAMRQRSPQAPQMQQLRRALRQLHRVPARTPPGRS